MWINYLMHWLVCSLAVSAAWIGITRRYHRLSSLKVQEYDSLLSDRLELIKNQQVEMERQRSELERQNKLIEQKRIALRVLYDEIHHNGARKATASLLGLFELYWRESRKLRSDLVQLEKPGHHKYAGLAKKELDDMDEFIKKAEVTAQYWYDYTPKAVQQFEHLQ